MEQETQYNNTPRSSKVFISYSHDSPKHKERVSKLSNLLRSEGIDCNIDQYEISPPEGWPRWMIKQIEEADYVLVVCTDKYEKRFKGEDEVGKGLGGKWEGAIITQELYYSEANNKFIPIVFSLADSKYIPSILKSATYYNLSTEEVYNELYARLTGQKLVSKPAIGELRLLKSRNFFDLMNEQNKDLKLECRQKPAIGELRPINDRSFTSPSTGMEFRWIPEGEFMMGSEEEAKEEPIHKVKIKKPFYLGKYPVTQKQWETIMGSNPSIFEGENLPVQGVSWRDTQAFIDKLNEKEHTYKYRLPSEAEWEYACRAGTDTRFSFGDDESKLNEYGWCKENSDNRIHPIGQRKPNSWGLYDMHGNVWEWVQDKYHDNYKGAPSDGSAWEEGGNCKRVRRGGGWSGNNRCRSASRYDDEPDVHYDILGFRVLRTL